MGNDEGWIARIDVPSPSFAPETQGLPSSVVDVRMRRAAAYSGALLASIN
jgi:hypothetical protein